MDFFDDGPEKPIRIWSRIGRRPILAAGNSNGDIPMLDYTGSGPTTSLRILIRHDDADREFAYDAGAEDALARASAEDWTVVSMRDDWTSVLTDAAAHRVAGSHLVWVMPGRDPGVDIRKVGIDDRVTDVDAAIERRKGAHDGLRKRRAPGHARIGRAGSAGSCSHPR